MSYTRLNSKKKKKKIEIISNFISTYAAYVIPNDKNRQDVLKAQPITRRQILDFFKLKEFADDNFKFDESGRKLSKRIENTVGKGEIARFEQFLLIPHCFQKACFPGASKDVIVWEWVNAYRRKNVLCAEVIVEILRSAPRPGGSVVSVSDS